VAFDLIEHLTRSEVIGLASSVLRILKPAGRWIIHTPNGDSPFFGSVRYGDVTHEQAFTGKSLRQLLLPLGFSEVLTYEDRPVVHGTASLLRRIVWTAMRQFLWLFCAAETGSVEARVLSQNLLAVARKS
jgi:hypothetical protein